MPWSELSPMELRRRAVAELQVREESCEAICERYGISRKTAYKWLKRFELGGLEALFDRPPIAQRAPHALPEEAETLIIWARLLRPTWGPKKLRLLLGDAQSSNGTMSEVLRRHGLSQPRRRTSRKCTLRGTLLRKAAAPNDVWCADFKGDFLLGNRRRCYPLTVTDQFSRYLLGCDGYDSTKQEHVRGSFERMFREYGMPHVLRTDNGVPFVSTEALWNLSELSVWLLRLGIALERTRPATPSDNGRHERMHRTLNAEACTPPQASMLPQQRVFDGFRSDYNEDRPHEAIGFSVPSELYEPSPRPYPRRLPQLEYSTDSLVRRVKGAGWLCFHGHEVYLGRPLSGQDVGLTTVDGDRWTIRFGSLVLAIYDAVTRRLEGAPIPNTNSIALAA